MEYRGASTDMVRSAVWHTFTFVPVEEFGSFQFFKPPGWASHRLVNEQDMTEDG